MFSISVEIKNVQHIKYLYFQIDLTKNNVTCILGKNGIGKTILFKSLQNFITSSTFAKTSNQYIFNSGSSIKYIVDQKEYLFEYDDRIETLDFKGVIPAEIKKSIFSELPIPFGSRFNQFQSLGNIDKKIREKVIVSDFNKPVELIENLNYIYDTKRFDTLKEIIISNEKYYVILKDDYYYIREDYLSSAEYFIINIYKLIKKGCKLIAIDEIDISLDSMAQVRLIDILRKYTSSSDINILFSTHSLALIKTLKTNEFLYMENNEGYCTFECKSYNYIKSLLYGFKGYDKYILTEDDVLKDYLNYILSNENIFSKYIIIYIGGGNNTVDLMTGNCQNHFFAETENVLTILDGDQKGEIYCSDNNFIKFIPFQSIEKDLKGYYDCGKFSIPEHKKVHIEHDKPKIFYKRIIQNRIKSKIEIFDFLNDLKRDEVNLFKTEIVNFLN